jgi:ribosomal protein L21E
MEEVERGDRVRVDIPDETDLDHDAFHGRHGEVVDVVEDDAGAETGDPRDSVIYRVRFDDGSEADFRRRDLRPPIDETQ